MSLQVFCSHTVFHVPHFIYVIFPVFLSSFRVSVYADTLCRSVLRRAITLKLNAKKQAAFNKRFTDFETQHGTEQSLKEAEELINSVC